MTSRAQDPGRGGLRLRPMRPLVYRESAVRDLADVTMRPVEVWDEAELYAIAKRRPDHVVHLVAPELTGPDTGRRGQTLQRWRAAGVVAPAPEPGLFAWTWEVAGRSVRGVAGAVTLPVSGSTLPHEDVRPTVVRARRGQLMRSGVQVEPIVVLHDGDPLLGETLRQRLERDPALLDLSVDGERHRVWSLTDPVVQTGVRRALDAAGPPVVADGHHRMAALDGVADAAWATALVLVVDTSRSDLSVGSVHRVIPGLDMARVRRSLGSELPNLPAGTEAGWLSTPDDGHLRWVLGDESQVLGLDLPIEIVHAMAVDGSRTGNDCCGPVARDTCHLHSHLLPAWGIDPDSLGYVHDWGHARRRATQRQGLAVRTSAPSLVEVVAAARAGLLLPQKATSIGPKPRIGLVLLPAGS